MAGIQDVYTASQVRARLSRLPPTRPCLGPALEWGSGCCWLCHATAAASNSALAAAVGARRLMSQHAVVWPAPLRFPRRGARADGIFPSLLRATPRPWATSSRPPSTLSPGPTASSPRSSGARPASASRRPRCEVDRKRAAALVLTDGGVAALRCGGRSTAWLPFLDAAAMSPRLNTLSPPPRAGVHRLPCGEAEVLRQGLLNAISAAARVGVGCRVLASRCRIRGGVVSGSAPADALRASALGPHAM